MTKNDMIQMIYESNDTLTKKAVDEVVNAVFNSISDALEKGDAVDIHGFGKFEIRERSERTGINPMTKEKITVPASKNVKFKMSKSLKDKVNQ